MAKTLTILPLKVDAGYTGQHGYQGLEAANQKFEPGNLISPDADGKYTATAAGAAAAAAKNRIALCPGQNEANPHRKTEFAHPRECGWIEATLGGVATTADLLEPGKEYGYAIDATTGRGYVNLADTANKVFRITSPVLTLGEVGDTNPRGHVELIPGTY